jgi:hypothetical protein
MSSIKKRWTKEIYIAKQNKDINGEPIIDKYGNTSFAKPQKYVFNVQPIGGTTNTTSARTKVKDYGQKAMQMQRAVIDYDTYFGVFNIDDLAYLDGVLPKNEEINGQKANYRIDAVLNQNKAIVLYFEKLADR